MFLNLKNNKRVIEVINNQHSKQGLHPKTHRDEYHQRQSKQHKEIKSYRQHQNFNSKKQVGSTALSTIQPTNSSFSVNNNALYVITRQESAERNTVQMQSKSNQKLDSHRLERVASAYRKIKKFDNNDASLVMQEGEKSHERLKKMGNKSKVLVKKQLLSNIVNNYICATQAEEYEYRALQKHNSKTEEFQQMFDPFLELFASELPSRSSRLKSRSHSSRDIDLNKSLQKNGRHAHRQIKKKSNQILIRDSESNLSKQPLEDIHSFMNKFIKRLDKTKQAIDTFTNSKYKYVQSPLTVTIHQLFQDIEIFMLKFYEMCVRQMDSYLAKFQSQMSSAFIEEQQKKKQYNELERVYRIQKQKSNMLEKMLLIYQQKSVYSTIFLNQLSFDCDIDSHLRQKLYQKAKQNGAISQFNQSQMEEGRVEQIYRSEFSQKTASNINDRNQNEFISHQMQCFNNCMPVQNLIDRKK